MTFEQRLKEARGELEERYTKQRSGQRKVPGRSEDKQETSLAGPRCAGEAAG